MIYVFHPGPGLLIESGERIQGAKIESRPETLTHEPDGALDLSFGFGSVGMAGSWHEPVVQNPGSARSSALVRLGSQAPRFSCCRSAPPR